MVRKNTVFLLVAHGSRRTPANLEVYLIGEKLEKQLGREVVTCFLELGEPNIPEGVDRALAKSPGEIVVLPYFLTQGRHLEEDIPKILSEKARAYPETPIRVLDYVGKHPKLVDLLASIALEGI